MRRSLTGLWLVLVVAGILTVAGPASRRVRRVWDQRAAGIAWEENLTFGLEPSAGEPVARLQIPAVGLDTWVLGGATEERLHRFPCLEQVGTSTLIMAHRDLDFRSLEGLMVGHQIAMQRPDSSVLHYRVLEVLIVEKDRSEESIRDQRDTERLLLLTCYPFRFAGPAPERLVVLAELLEP